jgi:hypothetical protein
VYNLGIYPKHWHPMTDALGVFKWWNWRTLREDNPFKLDEQVNRGTCK